MYLQEQHSSPLPLVSPRDTSTLEAVAGCPEPLFGSFCWCWFGPLSSFPAFATFSAKLSLSVLSRGAVSRRVPGGTKWKASMIAHTARKALRCTTSAASPLRALPLPPPPDNYTHVLSQQQMPVRFSCSFWIPYWRMMHPPVQGSTSAVSPLIT